VKYVHSFSGVLRKVLAGVDMPLAVWEDGMTGPSSLLYAWNRLFTKVYKNKAYTKEEETFVEYGVSLCVWRHVWGGGFRDTHRFAGPTLADDHEP
jgi:hypothetical protein